MEIKFDKNSASFEIDFNFYDYPSIIEAAHEFTESCWVSIQGSEECDSLFVRIEPKDKKNDVRDAVFSFFNYILGIMTRKMKGMREEV